MRVRPCNGKPRGDGMASLVRACIRGSSQFVHVSKPAHVAASLWFPCFVCVCGSIIRNKWNLRPKIKTQNYYYTYIILRSILI